VWRAQAATGSTGLGETFRVALFRKGAPITERDLSSVELLVRDARLTDIDRITGLMERVDSRWSREQLDDAADVLRQMIYLPNVALLVCLDGRMIFGACALALRPSVSAVGMVGTVDALIVEPGHELNGVVDAMLQELMRQARNKGCVALEGDVPAEPAELARWEAAGFTEAGQRMRLPLVRAGVAAW
jgi:N-acetylglutamate synthase-like GNAT family acetyltransferase